MSIIRQAGDRISPSHLDVRVLIALSKKPMGAYEAARVAEGDIGDEKSISNGTIGPVMVRLERISLIRKDEKNLYHLTSLGKMILEAEVAQLARLVKLARDRTAN